MDGIQFIWFLIVVVLAVWLLTTGVDKIRSDDSVFGIVAGLILVLLALMFLRGSI